MAKCRYCNQEMLEGVSCLEKIQIDNKIYHRLAEDFFEGDVKCHDCGIKNDGKSFHHYGCDMERCPVCGSQIISCDCNKESIITDTI